MAESIWKLNRQPLEVSIWPATPANLQKLNEAMEVLTKEDPTYGIDRDEGRLSLRFVSESHLEALVTRLREDFHLDVNLDRPWPTYLETITQAREGVEDSPLASSGRAAGQVVISVSPLDLAEGDAPYQFVDQIHASGNTPAASDDLVPREFIPTVEDGIRDGLRHGPLGCFPVVGVKVCLTSGRSDTKPSRSQYFGAASRAARKAVWEAEPILIEPLMAIEVSAPTESAAVVEKILLSRRGIIEEAPEKRGDLTIVTALIPAAQTLGLAPMLDSQTKGKASLTMQYHSHAQVPGTIEDENSILAEVAKRHRADRGFAPFSRP